jgi:hypothetical protein
MHRIRKGEFVVQVLARAGIIAEQWQQASKHGASASGSAKRAFFSALCLLILDTPT